jgi:hypothetical protein
MFVYRLHTVDGDDVGKAAHPDRVKIGEELFVGGVWRFRVLDVVLFDEAEESHRADARMNGQRRSDERLGGSAGAP